MFDLERFIADLHATFAERSRQAMKEIVERVVRDPVSLLRWIGEPKAPGAQVLFQVHDLTVLNAIWASS